MRQPPLRDACAVLMLTLGLAGCGAQESGVAVDRAWVGTITTEGNVTTVVNESGSVWGGPARLVEEASIGVEFGEDAYMFGQVRAIAATDEEIYVLDQQVSMIRVYDVEGRHLRDIGKEGEGPGEFRQPASMVIGPKGRIYVRDARNGRISVLSPEGGELATMHLNTGFSTSTPMVITTHGQLYNSERTNPTGAIEDWGMAMVPRSEDDTQEGEPIFPPELGFDNAEWRIEGRNEGAVAIYSVPFAPSDVWTLSPSGAVIGGVSEDYSFEIRHPDGRITRVVKDWDPVPVDPDEGEWFKRNATARMRRMFPEWIWNGSDVPSHKPAYSQLLADLSGRIWVRRPGSGYHVDTECHENPLVESDNEEPCWREHTTWDVFDEEGRFLGKADVPEGISLYPGPYIRDDVFLSSFMDEMGTIMVKRYRLVLPGER